MVKNVNNKFLFYLYFKCLPFRWSTLGGDVGCSLNDLSRQDSLGLLGLSKTSILESKTMWRSEDVFIRNCLFSIWVNCDFEFSDDDSDSEEYSLEDELSWKCWWIVLCLDS